MIVIASYSLLAPAAMLILWTIIISLVMLVIRLSAFKTANIDLTKAPPGGRGQDLEGVLPKKANWPSHNYAHLLEQPTIFYATIILLALMNQGTTLNIVLAWIYVGFRMAHSIWQMTINTIPVRFTLFILSSAALTALAFGAVSSALS